MALIRNSNKILNERDIQSPILNHRVMLQALCGISIDNFIIGKKKRGLDRHADIIIVIQQNDETCPKNLH